MLYLVWRTVNGIPVREQSVRPAGCQRTGLPIRFDLLDCEDFWVHYVLYTYEMQGTSSGPGEIIACTRSLR